MEKSVLVGGFGGQGVQTMGKLLAYTANEMEKCVTFAPAYGGEMRGGTSNCTITISDRQISSPTKVLLDYVVAMNIESFLRFEQRVKPGGVFILNTSIVKNQPVRSDITTLGLPANEIALDLGSDKVLNVITLGFLVAYSKIVDVETAKQVVAQRLGKKEEFRLLNDKAFQLGVEYATAYYPG